MYRSSPPIAEEDGSLGYKKDGFLAVKCEQVWLAFLKRKEQPRGSIALFDPDHCEPIVPDGAKPSEFKTCNDLLNSLQGELVVIK